MSRFLVVPREDPAVFADLSPEEMQTIIERYVAWSHELGDRLLAGDKLADGEGRVLRGGGDGVSATDGPYTETKEVVGGFWIVEAADLDGAAELVAGSPHLEFGSLEIRRIEELADADDAEV